MNNSQRFSDELAELKDSIAELPDGGDEALIEQTAQRLRGNNFMPPVVTPPETFLRLTQKGLQEEVERILAMPETEACAMADGDTEKCEDIRLQFIRVLIFYYKKLVLLRQGDSAEWDEIDELYIHD